MNDTPLSGADKYLRGCLAAFPHYNWLDTNHPAKTSEHVYVEEGWELIQHLEMIFFKCSSSVGNTWPFGSPTRLRRLFNVRCQWKSGCDYWCDEIINQIRIGPGENDWKRLDNAPVFLCRAHGHLVREVIENLIPR